MPGPQARSTWRWSSWSCYTGLRYGSLTNALGGCWDDYNTGWTSVVVRQPWQGRDGVCEYPPLDAAMEEAGLHEVNTFIYLHQNKVTHFIQISHIMYLCLVAERRPGSMVTKRWCNQDEMDVERRWMAYQEAERTEGEEETYGTDMETY